MTPRKLLSFIPFLLAMLGLFLLAQTLPARSQGNPAADLVLHKAVAPLTALEPGDEIQYTLTFSNAGVLTATDVLISDTLPTLLTGVAVASNLPITATGQASWIVAPLTPGAGGIITVTATVSPLLTSELPFTNTATITSPITDTQPANNTSFVVSAVNLPPVVDAGPDQTAFVDEPLTLSATFTDPGLGDTHSAVLTWGDGLTVTLGSITSPFTATHVYSATGAFTATLRVTDSDGGVGEDRVSVTVAERVYARYLPMVIANPYDNPLNTVQVSPSPNSFLVTPQSTLSAVYGTATQMVLLSQTITTSTVILHSFQSGNVTGTLSVNGNMLTLTPSRTFQPGETFQATLTTGIGSLIPDTEFVLHPNFPTVWQFQAGVNGGSGYMGPTDSPTFGSGDSTDLALGDLDLDGDWDVVVTNGNDPSATVWLNDGTGQFSPQPVNPGFGTGGYYSVALGDLDRDGDLDAVFSALGVKAVWLNGGQGTFSPHPTVPTFGLYSQSDIALGDMNGDGFLDAVVANSCNSALSGVWLNDGTGAFFPPSSIPPCSWYSNSTSIALGDIDGDFDLDAVVADWYSEAEVFFNNGKGQFITRTNIPAFGNSLAVQLGDLDKDGDLDVVFAHDMGAPETVWMNDGAGSYSPHPTTPNFGGGDSTDLSLGDLDGDGDLDAVVANTNGEPETLWLNDGVGSFSEYPGTPMLGAGDSHGVVLGDLNGDWDLEVIVANNGEETVWMEQEIEVVATVPEGNGGIISQTGAILITFNSSIDFSTITLDSFTVNGSFTGVYPGIYSFPAPNQVEFTSSIPFLPGEQIFISLNHTILSEEQIPLRPFVRAFRVEVQGGTGSFEVQTTGLVNFNSYDVVLGDLDGDRDLDVLTSDISGSVPKPSIWLNDGQGGFTPHPTQPLIENVGNVWRVVLGDLDRDGDLDVIFSTFINDFSTEPNATVWLNDGTGQFSYYQAFPTHTDATLVTHLADIDGDGDLDALERANLWLNDGTGFFTIRPITLSYGSVKGVGDVDNDGDLDLIFSGQDYENYTQILKNNGEGFFTNDAKYVVVNEITRVKVVDLDNDSDLDLILGPFLDSGVYLNDGSGNFIPHPITPIINVLQNNMEIGDLDGDSDLDLVYTSAYWTLSTNWINDGLGNFTPHPTFPTFGTNDEGIAFGDIDGDGDLDVVISSRYAPSHSVWLNQNQ